MLTLWLPLLLSLLGPADPARATALPTITFLIASDSHFGASGMDQLNRSLVRQLNELPGVEYPAALGGSVGPIRGLLHLGDMTDSGLPEEWKEFEAVYGRNGRDGLLKYPVFEAVGNHDIAGDSPVAAGTRRRHGSLVYSWDWDDLHLVCLGMYPDASGLTWLARDLGAVGRERPVVLFFHYSIEGPYSEAWSAQEKEAFAKAIAGYNLLAIFHGHYHRAGRYQWQGHDVFLPGSPRHSSHAFLAVRVSADQLAVGVWDLDKAGWTDGFVKAIRR